MPSIDGDGRTYIAGSYHGPSPLYKSLPARPPSSTGYEPYQSKGHATETVIELERNKQHIPKSRRHWISITTWWQEATAMFLLIGSTVASFATLYPYQGKPLPEWPYAITIGALLSAYSVVLRLSATFLLSEGLAQSKWRWFKTAKPLYDIVLHDNASRGPIGAVGLLWRLPLPVTWQWMGCVLVVIALLVGPFTQQVIQYEVCSVPATESIANIPRASVFMGKGTGNTDRSVMYPKSLVLPEQVSINRGIYTPGSGSFTCDSGNCTFASYTSVGYCSSCDDISSQVLFRTVNRTTTSYIPDEIYPLSTEWKVAKQSSPHGSSPQTQQYASGILDSDDLFKVLIGLPGTPTDPSTGVAPTGCEDQATNQTWRCQGYAAASCSVFPCIRTYSANVTNGVLREKVIETERDVFRSSRGYWFDWLTRAYAALDLSCVNDEERDELRRRNYTVNTEDRWLSYNISVGVDYRNAETYDVGKSSGDFEQGLVDRGCLYTMDQDFDSSLQTFMGAFGGDLTGVAGDASRQLRSLNGSQVLQTIYNYGNFSLEHTSSLFENMTTSLTNYMRSNPGNSDLVQKIWTYNWTKPDNAPTSSFSLKAGSLMIPAQGQSWTTKTCVRVSWPWLALPTALALLTLVFFVGVTISCGTLPRDMRTWKTSPLPLLFYGPGANDLARSSETSRQHWSTAESQHVDDLNSAAKRMDVCLQCDHSGTATFRHQVGKLNTSDDSL